MKIMFRVYDVWVRIRTFIDGRLERYSIGYQNAVNLAKAEKFLREFRNSPGYEGVFSWTHYDPKDPKTWFPKKRPLNPNCSHLKGGAVRRGHRDYNFAFFKFSDGTCKIWCLNNCGFVSHPGDPSWERALELFDLQSTNRPASSEIMPSFLWKESNVRV